MMNVTWHKYAALGFAAVIGSIGQMAAADNIATLPNACEIKFDERYISVLLCEPGLDQETLSKAGMAVCDSRLPCGARIWSDATLLPAVAPQMHDDLNAEQVSSAVGVWVAEQSILIEIDKLSK